MKKGFKKLLAILVLALMFSASDISGIMPMMPQIETVSAITVNKQSVSLKVGKTKKLKASDKQGKVKWSSKNKSIATVDGKGNVTAVGPGETTITAKDKKTGETVTCKVRVYTLKSPSKVKSILQKQQSGKYPEGKAWTNANPNGGYLWQCAHTIGYGCYGFAAIMSDKIFGTEAPLVTHKSFAKIQAGDHIRIGDYHSVIGMERNGDVLTVAEGNFNSSIHWGRQITKSELKSEGFTVYSRG